MIISENDYLLHYGTPRKSGRYPWGSGAENESQRNRSFLDDVAELRKSGMSEADIAKGYDMTTTRLRALKTIATNQQKQERISTAQKLKDAGMSPSAIGREMGINESSVRDLLAPGAADKADVLQATSDMLRRQVAEKEYIDIGAGVELQRGLAETKLKAAVAILEEEGYVVHKVQVQQATGTNKTTVKVLAPPGTTYRDIVTNMDKIQQINEYSEDGGRNFFGTEPPLSISSKRVGIKYAEDGGTEADGVMYVRPGVKDVSLGGSQYAQVRVMVEGTHFIKGMAVYKDGLPAGVDIQFNTNKSNTGNKLDALKKVKRDKDGVVDQDNPFGAVVRQIGDNMPNGRKNITSSMNIVNEEADWDKWSRNLSTQLLSKQSPVLAKQQLDMTFEARRKELDEILRLTNPAVKKKLLQSYADGADSAAVHLRAKALPGQKTHVIMPVNTLKPTEVYAPNYLNGTRVALVRYPHAGTFEIPELVVNNNHVPAKKLLGDAKTAIGINHKVAEKLSGADFDGDTVLVIPNNSGRIKSSSQLEGLRNFDPQKTYAGYDGMRTMGGGTWDAKNRQDVYPAGKTASGRTKGTQMGLVSNLITDMTIRQASSSEMARAVRHSMVVIDAEKHGLDWKKSAKENGIAALNTKYQDRSQGGSSTLISKATSAKKVEERRLRPAKDGGPIDPATGKLVYVNTGRSYVNAAGKTVMNKTETTKLAFTEDAFTLSSGTKIENLYAGYSNNVKGLANEARREMLKVETTPYNPSAKAAYSREVVSLNAKLNTAKKNAPLERQAQLLAATVVAQKKAAYPDMEKSDLKKIQSQAIVEARRRTNAGKERVFIEPREWDAIQAGAISNAKLESILDNADLDQVKSLATPRVQVLMTSTKTTRAKSMAALGYTQAEIAEQLGVSVSTLQNSVNG